MKKTLILICSTVLLAGCVRYDITLSNGTKLIDVPKPKLDRETQMFTIKTGINQKAQIPYSRVILIEPHKKVKGSSKDGSDFYLPAR